MIISTMKLLTNSNFSHVGESLDDYSYTQDSGPIPSSMFSLTSGYLSQNIRLESYYPDDLSSISKNNNSDNMKILSHRHRGIFSKNSKYSARCINEEILRYLHHDSILDDYLLRENI